MTYNYRDDPVLGPALSYWTGKRSGRSMPRKRDIDPIEIPPKILPNLQIIDAIDGGARFRYRLIGTALVEAYGRDFSGRIVDELFPDGRLDFVQSLYRSVCTSKAPIFSRNKYHTPRDVDLFSMRIYMPLSEDGVAVQHILGVMRFEYGAVFDEGLWDMQATPEWHHTEAVDVDGLAPELAL
ncbi:MAG TPA: PAS domain-containing protein [Stellaceae bacterium]|jgi:hypothetical protein|nr:PAS domain-containing protein [Stellaceae bacterium]